MFNKKRIFIFVIFLLCLFFLMTFAGGSRDEGIVTRLVEFYDGFDDSLISSTNVEVGKDAEVPKDPKHENYVFAGWYLYDDHDVKVTKFTDIREDLKVIALYAGDLNNNGIADDEEDKLTVTFFDTLGNRVLKEEEVLPGLDATAPEAPTYDGYAFGGWSRGYTNITEDITVNTIYNNVVAPTINISENNLGSMLVYEEVPTFTATATDRNGNPVEVVITTNIDGDNAGSYTVTYTATDNDGNTTTITRDFVVERRNLEVTIDDKTSVYGEALEELTYEITDGVVVEEYLPGITLTKANGTNVGVYAITGTYSNRNYNITFINGIYTITKANYDVNVEFPQEDDLVYDGEEQDPIVVEELPETVIPEITYTDEEGNPVDKPVDAGDYDVEITFTCTDDNYNCPENIEGTITINKAPLTVVTGSAEKVYDGTALTAEGTLTGLVNGEIATLNVTGTQTNVGTSDNTYTIIWETAKESNYEVSETVGTLTVTQKDITEEDIFGYVFNGDEVTYNGETHSLKLTGLDASNFDVSYEGNNQINVGEYTVTAIITGKGNYTGTIEKTAVLVINEADISFIADNKTSEKGENLVELTYTIAGTIYGKDNLNINISTDANKDVAGIYDIVITASNLNYNITLTNAKYKVFNDENNNGKDDDYDTKYTVTFVPGENGSLEGTTTYEVLEGLTLTEAGVIVPTPKANEGYAFKEWDPSINMDTEVKAEATYTAKFSEDKNGNGNPDENDTKYTITFVSGENGSLEGTTTYEVLEGLTLTEAGVVVPTPKANEGYAFKEWTPSINMDTEVNAEVTYTATFGEDKNGNGIPDEKDKKYTVTFEAGENGSLEGTTTYKVLEGLTLTEAGVVVPTIIPNTGYISNGWDKNIDMNVKIKESITYIAQYEIKKFTATIKNFNDEILGYIENIPYGSSITSDQLKQYTEQLPVDITLGDGTVIEFSGSWSSNINNVVSDIVVTPIYNVKTSSATTVYELYPIHPIKDQGEGYDTSYYRVAFENLVIKFNSSEELSNLIAEANKTDSQVNIAFGMENVFKYLTEESKATLQSLDTDEYYYDWFVLKYDRHDGWHLDGIRRSKTGDPVMDISKDKYILSNTIKIMADGTASNIQISINGKYYDVKSDEKWGYRFTPWLFDWNSKNTVKVKYSSTITNKTYIKEFNYSNGEFTLVGTTIQD